VPNASCLHSLQIWNKLGYILVIGSIDEPTVAKITLTLAGLAGKNMAGKCTASLDFSGTGFFETLGSTTVGLDFWHPYLPITVIFISWGRQS
jgi:hypothetical protein